MIGSMYNPISGSVKGDEFIVNALRHYNASKSGTRTKNRMIRPAVIANQQSVELTDQERSCLKAITKLLAGEGMAEKTEFDSAFLDKSFDSVKLAKL